jgi:hypothetical protein
MFIILSHERQANQNNTDILLQSYGHQQENKQQMLTRMQEKRNPYMLLVGL